MQSRDSSVGIATRQAEEWGFYSLQWQEIYLFSITSRPALVPTYPLIPSHAMGCFPVLKRLGREAEHSPPSSAEVRNCGVITLLPNMSSWHSLHHRLQGLSLLARSVLKQ
jgi:hypothetical protein